MNEGVHEALRSRGLWPHQVDFIESALDRRLPRRVLLTDDVGLGKSHSCAALLWAWREVRGRFPRTLVVAPRPLLQKWSEQLVRLAEVEPDVVDASRFRHLEARSEPGANPWEAVETAVTSLDFIKRDDRLSQAVAAEWDVVVVDEATSDLTSERGRVLQRLWKSPRVQLMVAASAAPRFRLDALGTVAGVEPTLISRRRRDLVDWEGDPLLGDVRNQLLDVVRIDLDRPEQRLVDELRRIVKRVDLEDPARRLVISSLVRAASSSLIAFEGAVRRALARSVEPALVRTSETFDVEVEEGAPPTTNAEGARADHPLSRDELQHLADLAEEASGDSKWAACLAQVEDHLDASDTPVVIFADFRDTVWLIADLLNEEMIAPLRGTLTGTTPPTDRAEAVRAHQDHGGILVLTSAAAQGVELARSGLCVHYDVPWSAAALAQRLGRFHRFGARNPVLHVAFADGALTRESTVRSAFNDALSAEDWRTSDVLAEILGEDG